MKASRRIDDTANAPNENTRRDAISSVFDELSSQFHGGSQDGDSIFAQLLNEHNERTVD